MLYEILVYKESSNFESFWEMQLYLVPGENWEQTTKPTLAVVSLAGCTARGFGCVHPQHGAGAPAALYCWGNCVWTQPSGPPGKRWSCASATASGLGAARPRQCWQLTHAPGRSHCSHIYTQCVPTNSCIICRRQKVSDFSMLYCPNTNDGQKNL